jgi:ribosomal-protein-alanine N-acetyltransferase
LRGSGVCLRELCADDAPVLLQAFAHPEVERYILPPPSDLEAFARFIAWSRTQREAGNSFCVVVVPEGAPGPVGLFQVHRLDQPFTTAEWGFIFARSHWGTGLFGASATLLLDFIFGPLGVTRLEARAVVDNVRAQGVLRKIGAIEEARLRRSVRIGGQFYDDALWAILDTDWAARRLALPSPPTPATN